MTRMLFGGFLGFMAVLWSGGVSAGVTPAQKCETAKLGAAEKYSACRLGAEKKAVLKGVAPDFTKCDSKYPAAWAKAETKYTTACPTSGDQTPVQAAITENTDALRFHLDGLTPMEGGSGPLQTGQTTVYGTGSDGDLQKGAARSFTDNGDGTITDNKTGLMWEKKDQSDSIHNDTNGYTWCEASCGFTNIMDGTITTVFLATLNGGSGFAGHTDWRIPNQNELLTLVNYQTAGPAADAAFNTNCFLCNTVTTTTCSCTLLFGYWSSTTYKGNPNNAWFVDFTEGVGYTDSKSHGYYVRAVRGGS